MTHHTGGPSGGVPRPIAVMAGMVMGVALVAAASIVQGEDDAASTAALEWELLEAETAVAQGEPRIAASHYRAAAREAFYLLGLIEVAKGDLAAAKQHLEPARNAAAVDLSRARIALALVELRLGEVEQPLRELRLTASEDALSAIA